MKLSSSLRAAHTINNVLLCLLPLLVVGLATQFILSRNLTEEINDKNQTIALSLTGEVETFLAEPLSLLQQLNEIVFIRKLITGDDVNTYIDALIYNYPFFEMVQYLSASGEVVYLAPFNEDFVGINMSQQPFFQKSIQTHASVWSTTFISLQSGHAITTISIPAGDGVLVGYLNLDSLSSMVEKLESGNGYAVITDQQGTIIADAHRERVRQRINLKYLGPVRNDLSGNIGTFTTSDRGEKIIASVVSLPMTGWLVIYTQNHKDAFSVVTQLRSLILLGFVLTAMVSVFLAVVGSRAIVKPLYQLVKNVRNVARGEYEPPALITGFQEIEELDQTVRIMASSIKRRENRIRERELQYRKLLETIPYGVQESDINGIITFTNLSYNAIFECEAGEVIGKTVWAAEPTVKRQQEMNSYLCYLVTEQPEPTQYFTQLNTYKGNIVDVQIDWEYKRAPDGNLQGFITIISDITEKKRLEENLRQAQKMEAVGSLAGGIAHDFNNILAAILGYSELVLDELPVNTAVWKDQQQIIKASHRARNLVQHLLLFSRKQDHKKSSVDIEKIVKEALELLRATLPATITFDLQIESGVSIIKADPTQIHQVVMNLCTNGVHAMEQTGGVLRVSLVRVLLEEEDLKRLPDLSPGKYARISIGDSGEGISPENLERIFEPFFTTKGTGKGTGMGLSVVHGIVSSHDGIIEVESTIGQGSVFQIFLPLIEDEEAQQQEPSVVYSEKNEHILVVDDEESIVAYTSTMLKRLGYNVTAVQDSREALSIFLEEPEKFDLLITDQTMPHLTGFDLARQILKKRAEFPILLLTGYSSTVSPGDAHDAGIAGFAMKPIDKFMLSQKVHKLLNIQKQSEV